MHTAKFINIICTDPRIQKFYHDYLVAHNLFGNYDTIQHENPILDFFDENKLVEMVERIKDYCKLHGADTIVLFDHFDCGAYKLNGYKFADLKKEREIHQANNAKVVNIIKENFPEMEVAVKYIDINVDGSCQWWQPEK